MKICLVFLCVVAALAVGANAKLATWPPKVPDRCQLGSEPSIPCSTDRQCQKLCGGRDFECVGCPECPDLKIRGTCFPKGTVAIKCALPDCDEKCTRGQKCTNNVDCQRACGKDFECQSCPGCPGLPKPDGSCVPKGTFIFCTLGCPDPIPPKKCKVGGCSSELCSDASLGDLVSPCIFKPEFACFKKPITSCGPNGPNGECGWDQTPELKKCIEGATAGSPFLTTAKSG